MNDPLRGAGAKVLRAQQHLTALEREIEAWIERGPYAVVREYYSPQSTRVVGLRRVEQPPPYLSLIVGDCAHNLRSALDYLTWELVGANHKTPSDRTAFPIFKRPDQYTKHSAVKLRGIEETAVALIESFQPYHAREGWAEHPLAILERLTDIDKHRRLLVIGAWVSGADRFTIRSPVEIETTE